MARSSPWTEVLRNVVRDYVSVVFSMLSIEHSPLQSYKLVIKSVANRSYSIFPIPFPQYICTECSALFTHIMIPTVQVAPDSDQHNIARILSTGNRSFEFTVVSTVFSCRAGSLIVHRCMEVLYIAPCIRTQNKTTISI